MERFITYVRTTLLRAICKLIVITVLAVYWVFNPDSSVAAALFAGAAVLWIIDGIDHGIDYLRSRT